MNYGDYAKTWDTEIRKRVSLIKKSHQKPGTFNLKMIKNSWLFKNKT
ncbi:hypothetical protein [Clostridium sp.]|jgi:hypothetical protein